VKSAPVTETPFTNRTGLSKRWMKSIMTLKRMEKAGLLPFLKIGKQVLYRMADVERIEQQAEVSFR
jgi:DNA-binding transcriptional regulator PaaX